MIKTSHYNPTHKNYFHRACKFAILSHCHACTSFEMAICPHPLATKENRKNRFYSGFDNMSKITEINE